MIFVDLIGCDYGWRCGARGCKRICVAWCLLCPADVPTVTDVGLKARKARPVSGFREPGFSDRQKAAQDARKNLLNKFKSQPGPDDPAVLAKRAEREALATKRAEAKAAREAEKAEQKRRDEEAAVLEAARIAREAEETAAKAAEAEAEQKARRDARYAARKAKRK
ncbi:DUF6481 family protein [Frankia sp. RB7]|nr:DUF6481 family protein [Frankia sp. RB7]